MAFIRREAVKKETSTSLQEFKDAMNAINLDPHQLLRQTLISLPREERIAIYLRFWRNETIEEIALALGISWEKADCLLSRAKEKLRERLSAYLIDNDATAFAAA